MKNLWQKVKNFFSHIWHGLTVAGRIIVALIIIGLIGLIVYAASDKNDNNSEDKKDGPEVAQVYEPSIGSPLPPDTSGNSTTATTNSGGTVSGASTTEQSASTADMMTAENAQVNDLKIAPATGIDPNAPIKYSNEKLKFTATLPAGSNVDVQGNEIKFISSTGKLQYLVSVNEGSETLASIQSQLQNSPSASNITTVKFAGTNALQFSAQGYGSGIAFVTNGKIYYLFGDSGQFKTFKLL